MKNCLLLHTNSSPTYVLVLKMSTFHFNGRYYSQKRGIAIGTEMGPSVACLLVGHLEELFSAQYEHSIPLLCKRHIDDILVAASCSEKELECFINFVTNFDPSVKYTYTIPNNTVTFLDLLLTIGRNHIKSCVHFEPLSILTIIFYFHPAIHLHASIPFHFS